jgi:hypothetical protein
MSARAVLEDAAEAMGGLNRILEIDSLVMTGFGQTESIGQRASAHPMSPAKWTAQNDVVRSFDLDALRALQTYRQSVMFPFAAAFAYSGTPGSQIQEGIAALNHPLAALRAALASDTEIGRAGIEAAGGHRAAARAARRLPRHARVQAGPHEQFVSAGHRR